MLHDHLKISSGADHSTKALAHVLLSLGELQVPFETVYPLVLAVCEVLHDRSPSMDATCAPLILSHPCMHRTLPPAGLPGSRGLSLIHI